MNRGGQEIIHCGPGGDEVMADKKDIIVDDPGSDDVGEVVDPPGDKNKADKAVRRSAKVDPQHWQAEPGGSE